MRAMLILLLVLVLAGPALATNGVLEINQTCAVPTGCFAGASAGFPVTISGSGSYVLTGSLTVGDANVDGIEFSANDVSIDLNGFSIEGPVICTGLGPGIACEPELASGMGIDASGVHGVTIKDGRVRGFVSAGIFVGGRAQLRDLTVESISNRAVRIDGSGHSIAVGLIVIGNLGTGILSNGSILIERSIFSGNGATAIDVGVGSQVMNNLVYNNGGTGIAADARSSVSQSTVHSNVGVGLALPGDAVYRDNFLIGNAGGTVTGGINAGGNVCNASLTCP